MEISLIVKAPNQKVPDQSYTCSPDWTVRQLKEHISQQYPTKPPIEEQRLIFAGAYLNDDAVLSEALRQRHSQSGTPEAELTAQAHTVHLVCTQDAPSRAKAAARVPAFAKPAEPASIVGEDGLRRRMNSSGPSSVPSAASSTPNGPRVTEPTRAPPSFAAWNNGQVL